MKDVSLHVWCHTHDEVMWVVLRFLSFLQVCLFSGSGRGWFWLCARRVRLERGYARRGYFFFYLCSGQQQSYYVIFSLGTPSCWSGKISPALKCAAKPSPACYPLFFHESDAMVFSVKPTPCLPVLWCFVEVGALFLVSISRGPAHLSKPVIAEDSVRHLWVSMARCFCWYCSCVDCLVVLAQCHAGPRFVLRYWCFSIAHSSG